jgi:hypothetical protein
VSGYTPVFGDIYMGTLYGKWPAAPVWASLLPLLDKQGRLDMSIQAIAGMTGWPIDLLEEGIRQLTSPDPGSRTGDEQGRRLIQIDPDRPWGWQAVNHGKYKEKARLMGKNAREVETGKNKDRLKDRRRPPVTAGDPPSDADTYADSNTNTDTSLPSVGSARKRASRLTDDFDLTDERKLVAEAENLPAERTFAKFRDYWLAASGAKARKHDWDATWRNWCRTEADRSRGNSRTSSRKTRYEELMEANSE